MSDIRAPLFNFRNKSTAAEDDLVESIKQHGLLNPIIVRTKEDNYFEIVAGFRRYLACKYLKWRKIPCHIVHLNETQTFEVSLVENIKRKSLSPLEEGNAFKMYLADKGWGSVTELSRKIGKSHSYITKRIALLDLPSSILEGINNKNLNPSVAEELLCIKDSNRQSLLAAMISKRHLTVLRAREAIKDDHRYFENYDSLSLRKDLQYFDKSIIALRLALNRIAGLIEDENENEKGYLKEVKSGNNFLIHELLRYHINCLNNQIDNLLKTKKKYTKEMVRYRKFMDGI